jgi:hypothetical protein
MAFVRGNISDNNVTHWMPLPEAPKTEKNERAELAQEAREYIRDTFVKRQPDSRRPSFTTVSIDPEKLESALWRMMELMAPVE